MPRISRFYGIAIAMYYNDHAPSHFHVKYAEHEATIEIDSLDYADRAFGVSEDTMIRVASVTPLRLSHVRLQFTDGTQRDINLEPYLRGPIFEPIRNDEHFFQSVTVDPELGTIVWPNGADIDPDVLYHARTPVWMATEVAP